MRVTDVFFRYIVTWTKATEADSSLMSGFMMKEVSVGRKATLELQIEKTRDNFLSLVSVNRSKSSKKVLCSLIRITMASRVNSLDKKIVQS